ncbi:fatty acid synthase, partial [Nephila pilipes]
VDVVLNSLADDKFQASIRCIAKNGRFIEIGKYDLSLDREIGLKIFLKNISFHAIVLDELFDSEEILPVLRMIQDDMRTGAIKPLDRTLFDRNSVEDAFKYMTKGIHVGKILLKIRDEETEAYNIPKRFMLPAVPDTQFYYNKVYIIIGGLGGFGMEVTKWMIRKGAKNLILTSRYGIRTSYHHFCLKKWQTQGINVQVSTLNASIKSEAETLLRNASCIAPVGGIFNSAMVLNDAFMNCQTPDTFKNVCAPKADATVYLDELTRKLCPSLDYFICFSSVSCGRGNAGQTNYGYANSVMDRICEERKSAGLHGLSIQWGIIGEVGKAQRDFGTDFTMNGLMAQSVNSCLDALDIFCQQDNPVVTSYVTSELTQKADQKDDQKNKMTQFIKILGYDDMSQIDTKRNLGEMGLDSFIKVETKDFIEFHSGSILSLQEIQGMNLEDIKALLDRSDRETDMQQVPTKDIKLPPTLLFKDPIITINKDAPGEPIFILDIGDVDVNNFQSIAKALNRPVHALVWTKEAAFTDMKTLASWYLKIIQNTVKGPFHIVGHSLGGIVAFEMALQCEKTQTALKTITLLNCSNDIISVLKKEDTRHKNSEVIALCKFVEQFTDGDVSVLREELMKHASQSQRIQTVLNYITSSCQITNENDIHCAICSYLQKQKLVEIYTPTSKLLLDINIIESSGMALAPDISEIKELFIEVCSGKISVHKLSYSKHLSTEEDKEQLFKALKKIV